MSAESWSQVMAVSLLCILAVIAITDVVAVAHNHDTVSAVVKSWARQFPILPFAAGLVAGHLFG